MAEKKKYEITEKELEMYIGLAMADIIPEDTPAEEEKKLTDFASGLYTRVRNHLNGSKPFRETEIQSYHVIIGIFEVVKAVSEALDEKTEENNDSK